MGTNPAGHVLHCLVCCGCDASGFSIMVSLATPASDGSTYWPKYRFDSTGDAYMVQLVNAEMARAGDRDFGDQVTATGTVAGNVLQVASLCFTPGVSNPG